MVQYYVYGHYILCQNVKHADAATISPQTTLEWLLLVADKPILSPQGTLYSGSILLNMINFKNSEYDKVLSNIDRKGSAERSIVF